MFAARRLLSKCFSTTAARSEHTLPKLPYDYKALEPVICGEIMELHHKKHHQGYVNGLNAAEEKMKEALERCDVAAQIQTQAALRFNGGGHLNHSIFWKNLSPCPSKPSAELAKQIDKDFGCMDMFRKILSDRTIAIQGSGWGWLTYCKAAKGLRVLTRANQDPAAMDANHVPLLGIDVWEHAYYLQYKNVRPDYVKAIWDIINWEDVSNRFKKATC